MIVSIEINSRTYKIDAGHPFDVSIPLDFYGAQPNAYAVERAESKPCEAEGIVGDTRSGGSCNFEQIKFIPHCNGTHTECVGHITNERISVRDCLKDAFVLSILISVEPENVKETSETYAVELNENDKLITKHSILKAFDKVLPTANSIHTISNRDLGTVNKELRTSNEETSTVNRKTNTVNKEAGSANKEIDTVNKEMSIANKEISIANKEISIANKETNTVNEESDTLNKDLNTTNYNALIVRTIPNDDAKLSATYLKEIPPFFSTEAMQFIREIGTKHLLVDTPSIDRIFDEGKLLNHRIFWDVEPGSFDANAETLINNTITELAYMPNEIADGAYLLNLQIAPFAADASPSRPILFKIYE